MLRSMSYAISIRKLFATGPLLSRLQPRQSCTPNLFIYGRHPTDFQIATLTRSPVNFKSYNPREREPCPLPPPPPPPPPKDDRMLWGTIALMFLTGGFVVYAKGSPEIRDWLTLNAPWFDDFIAVMYQENMTYLEFAEACLDDTKKVIERFTGKNKPKKCSTDGTLVEDEEPKKKEEHPCGPQPPPVRCVIPEEEKPKKPEDEDEDDLTTCEKPIPPVVTQNICDIEKCMTEISDCAMNNYYTAREACACYNKLVEDTMSTFTYKGMKELRHAMEERKLLVERSLRKASKCIYRLDEMVRYLDCGVQATKDQIKNTKRMHRDFHEKFKASFMTYQWENDRSTVMDRQWQIVEELVDKYTAENQYVFPGLDYTSKSPKITGDVDIVFTNSLRYIKHLEEQLKDTSDAMTERINRAIDDLPRDGAKNREVLLANALKDKKAECAADYKRREDEQKALNEKIAKDSAALIKANFEKSMALKLKEMEEQVNIKFDKMVIDQVAYQKRVFAAELEEMSVKLKVVEAKLNARLKAERETRRSQELWTAGASLLAATKKGDPYVKVDKELKAIEKASGNEDKLVLTVLKSIPDSVREKGIVPESVLRDTFRTMEKTARSVALVEQEGAAMPVYMLSWLQGLLLFMRVSGIPQNEFENPPVEVSPYLDTFDLLQRAAFWVDRGNLAVAVRYVDSLKGASRAAASKWYEEARAHLEVRQAAEAVLAHAAAMGLRYI